MKDYKSLDDFMAERLPKIPTEKIGRNSPCWCGSGKKFKYCHNGRTEQDLPNPYIVANHSRKIFSEGVCLHPDASSETCSSAKPIQSHSLQRSGALNAIAEKGHVLASLPTLEDLFKNKGQTGLRKVGLGKASTFPGFCSQHDSSLFKPIEGKTLVFNRSTAYLFAYRAIALEIQRKTTALKQQSMIRSIADRGRDPLEQFLIQKTYAEFIAGLELGINDLSRIKQVYDLVIKEDSYANVHYIIHEFDSIIPLVVSSSFLPSTDFKGTLIQDLSHMGELEHVTITITSYEGKSMLIWAWVGRDDGVAAQFARSFLSIPIEHRADAIINAALVISENVFVRPSWWDALANEKKNSLLRKRAVGLPFDETSESPLTDYVTGLTAARQVSVMSTLPGSALWA